MISDRRPGELQSAQRLPSSSAALAIPTTGTSSSGATRQVS